MDSNQHRYSYYNKYSNTTGQSTHNQYADSQSRSHQHARQSSSTPAQSYNHQTSYGTNQSQQGYGSLGYYDNSRDGGQRATDTLNRMTSSAASYPSTIATAYNQPQTSNSYNTGLGHTSTVQQSSSTTQKQGSSYSRQNGYGTSQNQHARPNSVNSVRSSMATVRSPTTEPIQHQWTSANAQYSRPQMSGVEQRSASPAQIQASHQLQLLANQRGQQAELPVSNQPSFVDPSAVYDPWPEYQRKLQAAQAAKEAEDRAAAEREAEEKRKADEEAERQLQEDEARKKEETERKKAEAAKKKAASKEADKGTKRKRKSKAAAEPSSAATTTSGVPAGMDLSQLGALANAAPGGSDAEAQIRSLMAMVKSMNDKHPDLLAKIWEEERQQHIETTSSPATAQASKPDEISTPQAKKRKRAPKKTAAEKNAAQLAEATAQNVAQVQATPTPASPLAEKTPASAIPLDATAKASPKVKDTSKGTIWPPEKKGHIAAAASKWLSSLPGNNGRTIKAPQVAEMLDKNPTYVELCEILEQMGFKFERSAFAKALLASVPGVNKSAASPAIPRPPSTGPLHTPVLPPPPKQSVPNCSAQTTTTPIPTQSLAQPSTHNNLPNPLSFNSPYFDAQGQPIPTTQQTPASATSSTKKANRNASESRKSESLDVKPEETPGPATKAEAARKRTFADLVDLTALSDDDLPPPPKQVYYGPPPVTQPGQAYSSGIDYLRGFDTVVDPYLQQSADRWSSTNNQVTSYEKQYMQASANKLNATELAKPIHRKNALRRSKYDVRTLARDVLLATGKHPDLLPLNGHLEQLRSVFTNSLHYNSDLATIRWDLIDPGEPTPAALECVVAEDKDSVIEEADDESEEERHFTVRAPSQVMPASVGGFGTPSQLSNMATLSQGSISHKTASPRGTGRPRGRPPGVARFSTGGAQVPTGNHLPATPNSGSPSRPIGYAQFNQMRSDGTKKRGRPVGWRKDIHGRKDGSGSAPASTKAAPPAPLPEMKFKVYKCQWQDCAAELHNLETLRQHIKKKHGVPDKTGKFTCLWATCGRMVQSIGEGGEVTQSSQRFNFPDTTELMQHVEGKHIRPIAWELGDGPPGGTSDANPTDSEAYLSDRHGRRVTPTIPAAAPSSAPASATRPAQRGRPPKKSDEEKARESQAELAKQKREIGLGVDREGATFANEKRRAGFVDDEDESEVFVDAMEE